MNDREPLMLGHVCALWCRGEHRNVLCARLHMYTRSMYVSCVLCCVHLCEAIDGDMYTITHRRDGIERDERG